MNFPIPVLDHWQKVQYGKPVKVIKLPTDLTGKDEVVIEGKELDDIFMLF